MHGVQPARDFIKMHTIRELTSNPSSTGGYEGFPAVSGEYQPRDARTGLPGFAASRAIDDNNNVNLSKKRSLSESSQSDYRGEDAAKNDSKPTGAKRVRFAFTDTVFDLKSPHQRDDRIPREVEYSTEEDEEMAAAPIKRQQRVIPPISTLLQKVSIGDRLLKSSAASSLPTEESAAARCQPARLPTREASPAIQRQSSSPTRSQRRTPGTTWVSLSQLENESCSGASSYRSPSTAPSGQRDDGNWLVLSRTASASSTGDLITTTTTSTCCPVDTDSERVDAGEDTGADILEATRIVVSLKQLQQSTRPALAAVF